MDTLTVEAGLASLQKKRYKAVHTDCLLAIKRDISNPIPYFLLGIIASDHGNFNKALELFARAEDLDPQTAHYPAFLGKTLSHLRRSSDAKLAADRAAALDIKDGYLADMIGVIYSRCGTHECAISLFELAVSLNPKQANFNYNLGASAQFLGDFDKAERAYDSAILIDPHHYRALASKVSLKKQTSKHNNLPQLKTLFSTLEDDENAAHQIGHAVAKTLEDLGEHEASFDWLIKAKAEKRARFRYDRAAGRDTFDAAAQTLNASAKTPCKDEAPLFVIGLPRTGTTLVDRILSSHSQVRSAGELNLFSELVKSETRTPSKQVLDAETFRAAHDIDLAKIGRDYIAQGRARIGRASRFVDKMPLNFFYAGLICKSLPNARIIALRRGAMDSCLSNFRQLLSVQESFYNYTFDLEDTAFFYSQFDALMSHWRDALPADRFMEIHYEDIVLNQENQTRQLLEFCDLQFEDACLRFHENAAPVSTASSVQVRQPLYSGSIDRWKKYGDRLDALKMALGPLADHRASSGT